MNEQSEPFKVLCSGGWNATEDSLFLAGTSPGAATRLVNYEVGVFGGYRRVEGYEAYDSSDREVGGASAEGQVLCVAIFQNDVTGSDQVIAARKDVGASTYSFYRHTGSTWSRMTGQPTMQMSGVGTSVSKVRFKRFNFGSGSRIIFVDGVNNATIFDGLNWYQVNTSGTGTSGSPGGASCLDAPKYVEVFQKHIFLAGDSTARSILSHSAPSDEFDFTAASGAGQIQAGFDTVALKPFRSNLFVFGPQQISSVEADLSAGFVIDEVTTNVGCTAPDSVQEIGGDLIFLSPDGFRPVAGTSRIGDVELGTLSEQIRTVAKDLPRLYDLTALDSVVIRSKSQVRFFLSDDSVDASSAAGIIGGLRRVNEQATWEFGQLLGIRASCADSENFNGQELVLHGDYDGVVYKQESGDSFDGRNILSVYNTPYLDFGDTTVRKGLRDVDVFIRAEGPVTLTMAVSYDWGVSDSKTPADFAEELLGAPTRYGEATSLYGDSGVVYGGSDKPVVRFDTEGSGFSAQVSLVTFGQDRPHSVQGFVFTIAPHGRH